jgi:flagellar biosynthesis chaperone FliJ
MTKRIDKLCSVKERAVDAAEGALAQARSSLTAAEMALAGTEQAWRDAQARGLDAIVMADLDDADARARTLRQAVQRADANVQAKKVEVARLRGLVAEARTELRRFEIWGERADATARATISRIARNAEDALAARSAQRGSMRGEKEES